MLYFYSFRAQPCYLFFNKYGCPLDSVQNTVNHVGPHVGHVTQANAIFLPGDKKSCMGQLISLNSSQPRDEPSAGLESRDSEIPNLRIPLAQK